MPSRKFSLSAPCLALGMAAVVSLAGPVTSQAQDAPLYDNLHVLPQDISRDELGAVMLQNLQGLGLPRRQNEGCLFCHVGDMDQPRSSWAWASDDKAP